MMDLPQVGRVSAAQQVCVEESLRSTEQDAG